MVLSTRININERLKKALSFVPECDCMADIGSDHGYASIYAVQNGIAKNVIATDISVPSLAKTKKLVSEFSLESSIECRAGNGFEVLAKGEAKVAFIAGMGAELIADIIENSDDIARSFESMVLQPMNSAEPLRRRITNKGYKIDSEGIVLENGKFYQILKCSCGECTLSDIECELGTYVYKERIPLAAEYIEHMINHYAKILEYVGENDTEQAQAKKREAFMKTNEYRRALEWAMSK